MAQTKCLFLTGSFILVLAIGPSNSQTSSSSSSSVTSYSYGFFNGTSLVTLRSSTWDLQLTKEMTFRTCAPNGTFLSQTAPAGTLAGAQSFRLSLLNGTVVFEWQILSPGSSDNSVKSVSVGKNLANNQQYTVKLKYYLGAIYLNVTQFGSNALYSAVIANATFNSYLLSAMIRSTDLYVGQQFAGCLYGGPGVNFNSGVQADNVTWNSCPLQALVGCSIEDQDSNDCNSIPCQNGATCRDLFQKYACDCPRNFNGTNCENDLARQFGCQISPCMNNGTCNTLASYPSGGLPYRCVCSQGFTGTNCEVELDECQRNPCGRGACTNLVNTYKCNCTGTGFQGANCTDDINECVNNPCGTGKCYNIPGSHSCECPAGLDGPTCQDINECVSWPCQNGATCRNGLNNYTCVCVGGFTGVNCQVNIDDCKDVTCPGVNSVCLDGLQTHQCVCKPGYTGTPGSCVEIDECISRPCQNSGSCVNLINAYRCDCRPGFMGTNCEINIQECDSNPCANNATCIDGVNTYTCQCAQGFTSSNCSVNINDCVNNCCEHGASCVDLVDDYSCTCAPGWTGPCCDVNFNECDSNPCQNGAACNDYLGYYNCTCAPGFTGISCGININECQPNPCVNGATCQDGINNYTCLCPQTWMGKNCSEVYNACSFRPCQNNASCTTSQPSQSYTCSCLPGFSGTNCENNIDDCVGHNCALYQRCYDGINTYTCGCPKGYTGSDCSTEINECLSNPCRNGATCVDGIGNYTCLCKKGPTNPNNYLTGFKGVNCEQDIDECVYSPSICRNGGTCHSSFGSYSCSCIGQTPSGELITGHSCELVTSYCIASGGSPCKNGATCQSITAGYTCHCIPGYTDKNCSTDIDECASSPCGRYGSCTDRINGYACACITGITGTNCETNIDDCLPNPCNTGTCNDGINVYTCDCFGTGFTGDQCERNIDDCKNDSCVNNATCLDGINNVTCACLSGYTGLKCEIDIAECASNPCQYGGRCLEYSNQTLYRIGYPGFTQPFSYANASGYKCECIPGIRGRNCEENIDDCVADACLNGATCQDLINAYKCVCPPGFTGTRCQTDINECDLYRPCQNDATCLDLVADYSCRCLGFSRTRQINFGGKNCSVALTGCDQGNLCVNGYCIPYLLNEARKQHGYQCQCNAGFAGRYCDLSTTVTFNASGSKMDYQLTTATRGGESFSLRFRTTLRNAVIVLYMFSSNNFVSVEIHNEDLAVLYLDAVSNISQVVRTQDHVSNAEWHQVYVSLQQNISVTIVSAACGSERCLQQFSYPRGKPTTYAANSGLYFGRIEPELVAKTITNRTYVGCMQDIIYDNTYLFPGQQAGSYFNMFRGCPRALQCNPYTCKRHGSCTDLWDSFQCHCERPYWGETCQKEYTAATFHKNSVPSSAVFQLPPSMASASSLNFSLFLRTRQEGSVITYLSNEVTPPSSLTYITLELQNGLLGTRLRLCTYENYFTSDESFIEKGALNFVQLQLHDNSLTLRVNGVTSVNATIPASNCPLQTKVVGFGKALALTPAGRRRRQTTSVIDISQQSPFNGVVQDAELQGIKLDFYDRNDTAEQSTILLTSQQNLTIGAQSTENVCNTTQPCENGGTCHDEYFNDFRCDCTSGYLGKNCSQADFCETTSCPADFRCQSLQKGFECIGVARFDGYSSLAVYNPSLRNGLPSQQISFNMRTRSFYGAIFETRSYNNKHFVKVRVWDGTIEVNYHLKDSGWSDILRLSPHFDVNDGEWYRVRVFFDNVNNILLQVSMNGTIVGESRKLLTSPVTTLSSLVTSGTVYVGDVANKREQSFQGCLEEFRVGGFLLPFLNQTSMSNNQADQFFQATSLLGVTRGCQGSNACQRSVCRNGGVCVDDWNDYKCQCVAGYYGHYCQDDADECFAGACQNNGRCQDGVGSFGCACRPGYTGNRCQTAVDVCANSTCDNGSTCSADPSVIRGYVCSCTDTNFTGDNCDKRVNQNCSSGLCLNGGTCTDNTTAQNVSTFWCDCPGGYKGPLCGLQVNYCANQPCMHGTCRSNTATQNYTCTCPAGYTGVNCETDINNCVGVTCSNRGTCQDRLNDYYCNCSQGWEGRLCETDVDECARNVCSHGSCQNLPGGFSCNCYNTGFSGKHCEKEINECALGFCVNGNCTDQEESFTCHCDLGFRGPNCSQANCSDNQCLSNATCQVVGGGSDWKCNCLQYYAGRQCEHKGPCLTYPCSQPNTARCEQDPYFFNSTNSTMTNRTCVCNPGWQGDDCATDKDECSSRQDSCANGATCQNRPGSYTCLCVPGYTGRNCEHDVNECESSPCEHGGTCTDGINSFTCDCNKTGYKGPTCQNDVDECTEIPAICNNGNCSNTVGDYSCDCGDQYLGRNCQKSNPCSSGPCHNGGSCNHSLDGSEYVPVCSCVGDYEGIMCQTSPQTSELNIMYIIGPIIAFVLLCIIIGVIVFIMIARKKRATRGAYSPSQQETAGSRVELGNVLKKPPEERLI